MAADAEDAVAAVGILDSQNRVAIGPCAVVDQVNDAWRLKVRELPTEQLPYLIGAASSRGGTAKRLPRTSTCGTAGRAATCRPDEGPRTRELDR